MSGAKTTGLAVNPFGERIEVERKPEAIEEVTIEISERINSMFEKYKKIYSCIQNNGGNHDDIFASMSRLKLEVLSPLEIDLSLQAILKSNLEDEHYILAGGMISRLVNDSYKSGNNNFTITTNDKIINNLFSNVHGTKENPMIATVIGNVGSYFGTYSEYCAFDVKRNAAQFFGQKSRHCNHTLQGNTDRFCGEHSADSIYNIMGNAGEELGYLSHDCTYNVNGGVGNELGHASVSCIYNITGKIELLIVDYVNYSTFNVLNKESYNLLIKNLPKNNTVQLVDDNDNVIMKRKKKSWLWFN